MKSWQTTLGGALSALGKTLFAIGVVPQLSGTPNATLTHIALAGYIIDAAGDFFSKLFAADAKALHAVNMQVQQNTADINGGTRSFESDPRERILNPPTLPNRP